MDMILTVLQKLKHARALLNYPECKLPLSQPPKESESSYHLNEN